MQIAQKLFQGVEINGETVGLITYMRTDSTELSGEAISSYREYLKENFTDAYLPEEIKTYKSKKAKNAQEAHEGIRPTDIKITPDVVKKYLDEDGNKLYRLIWKRSLASQMSSAQYERTSVDITSDDKILQLRANGSIQKFDGFLNVYGEFKENDTSTRDESNENTDNNEKLLPDLTMDTVLTTHNPESSQHFTLPPPRYSEASLVKKLEELGIGRPSTYASIISVLKMRAYVDIEKNRFVPVDRAILITAFLKGFFDKYVDYDFTADMENKLDDITTGKISWTEFLSLFWKDFSKNINQVTELSLIHI